MNSNSSIIKSIIVRLIGAITLAAYTLICTMIATQDRVLLVVVAVIGAICGALVCPVVLKYVRKLADDWGRFALAILLIVFSFYSVKGYLNSLGVTDLRSSTGVLGILMVPAIALTYLCAERFLVDLISELFSDTSKAEKYEYLLITVGISSLILWCYLNSSKWFYSFDVIYNADSDAVLEYFYLTPTVRTIRHPMISFLLFPIGLIAVAVRQFITPSLLQWIDLPFVISSINTQLILLMGMMLRKISGDRRIFRLFAVCFGPLSMCINLEKYPLLIFVLVAYVYYSLKGNSVKSAVLMGLSAGGWITSAAMGIAELFGKRSVSQKVKRIVLIIIGSVAGVICTGGVMMFLDLSEFLYLSGVRGTVGFGSGIRSFLNMVAGAVIPLDTVFVQSIDWVNIETHVPFLGFVIAILVIIGLLENLKKNYTKYYIIWLSFGFVFFAILRWGSWGSPLFSPYFSWAIIPPLIAGLRRGCKIFGWNDDLGVDVATIGIALMNVTQILVITRYLKLLE